MLQLTLFITEDLFVIVKEEGIFFARKSENISEILGCLSTCRFKQFVSAIHAGLLNSAFLVSIDSKSTILYRKEENEIKLNFPNFSTSFSGLYFFDFITDLRQCIKHSFSFNAEILFLGQLSAFSNFLAKTCTAEQANLCFDELEEGKIMELDKFLSPLMSQKDDIAKFIIFHSKQLKTLHVLDLIINNKI
jgi:hypothetical protein